jgi:hypothetical protein
LETKDYALKRLDVFWIIGLVPSEVDIDAASAQLGAKIAAGQQFIGPDQHMYATRQTGE